MQVFVAVQRLVGTGRALLRHRHVPPRHLRISAQRIDIVVRRDIGHRIRVAVRERGTHRTVNIPRSGDGTRREPIAVVAVAIGEQHHRIFLAGKLDGGSVIGAHELKPGRIDCIAVRRAATGRQRDHVAIQLCLLTDQAHVLDRETLRSIRRAVVVQEIVDPEIADIHIIDIQRMCHARDHRAVAVSVIGKPVGEVLHCRRITGREHVLPHVAALATGIQDLGPIVARVGVGIGRPRQLRIRVTIALEGHVERRRRVLQRRIAGRRPRSSEFIGLHGTEAPGIAYGAVPLTRRRIHAVLHTLHVPGQSTQVGARQIHDIVALTRPAGIDERGAGDGRCVGFNSLIDDPQPRLILDRGIVIGRIVGSGSGKPEHVQRRNSEIAGVDPWPRQQVEVVALTIGIRPVPRIVGDDVIRLVQDTGRLEEALPLIAPARRAILPRELGLEGHRTRIVHRHDE
ncbi:hypothetical protein D3C71_851730 [compost metagenome]